MLATGCRIGEVLAIMPEDVDPTERTVTIGHHLVRVKGRGIVRMAKRKGRGRALVLRVPEWSVPMWRARKLASGGRPLFPSWGGGWLDPSNVTKRIRTACDAVGYGWVHSHVLRKTVGTHLDSRGRSSSEIADQLGNTPRVVDKHYRSPRVANDGLADALESIMDTDDTGTEGP
jgi:integrase